MNAAHHQRECWCGINHEYERRIADHGTNAPAAAFASKPSGVPVSYDRVKAAMHEYDGDACRPEYGLTLKEVARVALHEHWDLAACFCPTCVLARAVLDHG